MKHHTRLALAGLLSSVALTVAACGAGSTENGGAGKDGAAENGNHAGMKGMEQDREPSGMASGMLVKNGPYSDERFIDAMIPHHRGAVEMAEVALENAEHEEVRRLSENIVSTQEAEIEALKKIKQEEFGTSRVPMAVGPDQMEGMGMMADPRSLADEEPFDKAFIGAMIPHHRSAIQMANVALERFCPVLWPGPLLRQTEPAATRPYAAPRVRPASTVCSHHGRDARGFEIPAPG